MLSLDLVQKIGLERAVKDLKTAAILQAVSVCGTKTGAAKLLGMKRTALVEWLRQPGRTREYFKGSVLLSQVWAEASRMIDGFINKQRG